MCLEHEMVYMRSSPIGAFAPINQFSFIWWLLLSLIVTELVVCWNSFSHSVSRVVQSVALMETITWVNALPGQLGSSPITLDPVKPLEDNTRASALPAFFTCLRLSSRLLGNILTCLEYKWPSFSLFVLSQCQSQAWMKRRAMLVILVMIHCP